MKGPHFQEWDAEMGTAGPGTGVRDSGEGTFLLFNTTYRKAGGNVCGLKGIWASGRSWHHVSEIFLFPGASSAPGGTDVGAEAMSFPEVRNGQR